MNARALVRPHRVLAAASRLGPAAARGRGLGLVAACALALIAGCAGSRREAPSPGAAKGAEAPAWTSPPSPTPGTVAPIPEPPPGDWRDVRALKVGLVVGARSLLVAGSTTWGLNGVGGPEIARERAGAMLRVARDGSGAIQVTREGTAEALWTGDSGDTLRLEPSRQGYSGWSGRWYRGTFLVFASQPEGLTLVNEVDIESYLRSVLPHEIGTPPESDFEAVKAQAIAARSYTLSYLGRRSALGFDLHASVEDQVYGGTAKENEQSDRALGATRGQVLVSGGAPIRALYSSACGERTANVEDVWPWPWTPYLRSVHDGAGPESTPYCSISPNYRWREEWDVRAFMAMLREYGPSEGGAGATLSGDFLDVRVRTRSRCGRVQDLAVTTTRGDWVLRGDRTRWGLRRMPSGAILRSSLFKIGVLRDAQGRPLKVIASGAGNGHGIGMCQWGAMGMARSGGAADAILRHYYKNATIARI
jgi:stage II sporulation protein D